MKPQAKILALAISVALSTIIYAEESSEAPILVITASPSRTPLKTGFDPKAPQQPIPANDGASFLKTVPGMSVIRKGGTDGDPVFRGMAASRLNILLDGENIYGGCGNRMDPPTAYVFPETYDKVTLLKGPQTVLYGPGNSAGTVLFEKKAPNFAEPGWKFNGSLTGGSFGRHDEVADVSVGNALAYVRANATNSHSEDYQDGKGNKVHSKYQRWSTSAAFGWTPDRDTRLEFSAARSDGQAAYADRSVDGSKFARENYGLKFDKRDVSPLIARIEAQAYYNYVDHVMDNYSMRSFTPSATTPEPSAMNPDRTTIGGRLAFTLQPASGTTLIVGSDLQNNKHTGRMNMSMRMGMMTTPGQWSDPYRNKARVEDARFANTGVFGELTQQLGQSERLIGGLRADFWRGQDKRATVQTSMMAAPVANPTANKKRDETLSSGFLRYERDLAATPATLYVGLGHNERFGDYWELIGKESATSISAFDTKAEKTTQLDLGATWKNAGFSAFVAGFYNRIDDYILIESNYLKAAGMGMTRSTTIARNIDASTWGGEAGISYSFSPVLKGDASLAYVRGNNRTDDRPLAQMSPLEGRFGLTWDNKVWAVGGLLRLVAAQHRVAINQGNIVGQDIGRTPGFGVFSLNTAYRPKKGMQFSAGVDNLFDKTYAEHISRSGALIPGFTQTARVNEPGRNVWVRFQLALD